MNERLSEMDKELQDNPDVSLVVAISMNKGKRNACLFCGIIALVVILLGVWEFGWSKWLLLLPAASGIGLFLYQMNIIIVSSELKRRSEMKALQELHEERDEAQRRLAFMESHEEIIYARLQEYLDENPDDDEVPDEVARQIIEECFLEHQIADLEAETAQLSEAEEMDEAGTEQQGTPEIIGIGCTVALWAALAGAIVGFLWALALSHSLIFWAILGACINAVFWLSISHLSGGLRRGRMTHGSRLTSSQRDAGLFVGSCMTMLCGLAVVVALVVWVIRLIL